MPRPPRPQLMLSLLLLLALYLRLRGLPHMEFKGDEKEALQLGLNLLADRPWATDAPWPRAGMLSSNGIANAPFFNHVMALFWGLTHDPVGATMLVALANWLCLPALYRWAERRIGGRRALVFLAALAVSPFAVFYSRKLWAQDLLLPGLTLLLYGLEKLRGPTFWRGLGVSLLALLPITQLHQSGPIFAAVLGLAVPVQWALDRRENRQRPIPSRPDWKESTFIAAALALHAFYVIPYVEYLMTLPREVFANRPKLPAPSTEYVRRLLAHLVPTDSQFFVSNEPAFFDDRETTGLLGWLARNASYYGSIATAVPLALIGAWHWLKTPRAIAYLGISWLIFVAMMIALRIPTYPHYVLILYPLPFLLLADGFRLPGEKVPGPVDRWLPRVQWAHVTLLFFLTLSYQSWLFARSGSPGDYGVTYDVRLKQAEALLNRIQRHRGAPHPATDPTLICRQVPNEVIWLVDWKARSHPEIPDAARLCDSWSSGLYRWELSD